MEGKDRSGACRIRLSTDVGGVHFDHRFVVGDRRQGAGPGFGPEGQTVSLPALAAA